MKQTRHAERSPAAHGCRFKSLDPGDVEPVAALLRTGSSRFTPAYYRWKLCQEGGPAEQVVLAVDRDGRPVFHLAGVPRRWADAGGERWCMVAVDAFTHLAFRRRGLLTEGAAVLFGRWRDAGVDLVLGLPNQQWGSRTGALGWQPVGRLDWLVLPLAPGRLLARRIGWPALRRLRLPGWWGRRRWPQPAQGWAIEETNAPGPELDQLASDAGQAPAGLIRDRAWVAWRYRAGPPPAYRLLLARRDDGIRGYLAFRVVEAGAVRTGVIADAFARDHDREVLRRLLAGAIERLQPHDVETVRLLAAPRSELRAAARSLGFLPAPYGFGVECVRLNPAVPLDAVRVVAETTLAGGDFDVV